jgi:hypothetical protein
MATNTTTRTGVFPVGFDFSRQFCLNRQELQQITVGCSKPSGLGTNIPVGSFKPTGTIENR